MAVTQQEISDYIKLLVELGDVWHVDEQYRICDINGKVKHTVRSAEKVPLKIFHPNMEVTDRAVVLIPFLSSLLENEERRWFWQNRSYVLAGLVQATVLQFCAIVIDPDHVKSGVKIASVLGPLVDDVDEKTADNLQQIPVQDWLTLFYNAKSHTAQLQSNILSNEHLRTELGKKIRKKDWRAAETAIEIIFGTSDLSLFKYTATRLGYLDCEARLNVLLQAITKLHEFSELLFDINLHPIEVEQGLEHLEEYHKATQWYASPEAHKASSKTATPAVTKKPWDVEPTVGIPIAPMSQPMYRPVTSLPTSRQMMGMYAPMGGMSMGGMTMGGMPVMGQQPMMQPMGGIPVTAGVPMTTQTNVESGWADLGPIK